MGTGIYMHIHNYLVHVPNNSVIRFVHYITAKVKYKLFSQRYDNIKYYNVTTQYGKICVTNYIPIT